MGVSKGFQELLQPSAESLGQFIRIAETTMILRFEKKTEKLKRKTKFKTALFSGLAKTTMTRICRVNFIRVGNFFRAFFPTFSDLFFFIFWVKKL